MSATAITTDPKLVAGAYLTRNGQLYCQLGQERDADNAITGRYILENAHGEHSQTGGKGSWVHRTITVTPFQIRNDFELVRESLKLDDAIDLMLGDAMCRSATATS